LEICLAGAPHRYAACCIEPSEAFQISANHSKAKQAGVCAGLRIAEVPISAALSLPLPREKAAAIAESKLGEPASGYTTIFDAVADAADAFCLRTSVPAL